MLRSWPGKWALCSRTATINCSTPPVFEDVAFGPLNLGLPADEVRRRVADALAQVGLVGLEAANAAAPVRR